MWKYIFDSTNFEEKPFDKWTVIFYFEKNKDEKFSECFNHASRKNSKRFTWYTDIKKFLAIPENQQVKIYFTIWNEVIIPFIPVEWGFLIDIKSYIDFQENITGNSTWWKIKAFLTQTFNIHSANEDQINLLVAQNTKEENIIEIIRKLPLEKQTTLLQSLQTEFWKWWSFDLKSDAELFFLKIGDIDNREIVIEQLKRLEQNNFENIENALSISKIDKILDVWEKNKENEDESFWQKLFENEEYTWVFQQLFPYPILFLQWETYVGWKSSKWRNGQWWVATDFIYKNLSSNSFALIEIKTPGTLLIEKKVYRWKRWTDNTNEIYPPNRSLSWSIIQLQNQIQTWIEDFLTTLGRDFSQEELNHLHPHWILLIWNIDSLTSRQKESFILFRRTIKDITIVTFDELFEKIKSLKQIYE